MVPLFAEREHADHNAEQRQVHYGRQKAAGEYEIVSGEENKIGDRQRRGPPLRDHELAAFRELKAADRECHPHQNHGRRIQPAGACQSPKASQYKQIQRKLEVMVDGSTERNHAELWGLDRHSFSVSGRPLSAVHERGLPYARKLPLFDNEDKKGRLCRRILAPKVTCRCGASSFVRLADAKSNSRNARMIQVRHRSYATYSRQPRQVRKEATVTGSCVCSEPPVPDFFADSPGT